MFCTAHRIPTTATAKTRAAQHADRRVRHARTTRKPDQVFTDFASI